MLYQLSYTPAERGSRGYKGVAGVRQEPDAARRAIPGNMREFRPN